jgi:hypothetical protein
VKEMSHKLIIAAVEHRRDEAEKLQKVLTEHGCKVKTRLGLHEAGDICSDEGLIVLQLVKDEPGAEVFLNDLNKLSGIRAKLVEL